MRHEHIATATWPNGNAAAYDASPLPAPAPQPAEAATEIGADGYSAGGWPEGAAFWAVTVAAPLLVSAIVCTALFLSGP